MAKILSLENIIHDLACSLIYVYILEHKEANIGYLEGVSCNNHS